MDSLDLTKLGKLIEKCKESGVRKLNISGSGVEVSFSGAVSAFDDNEIDEIVKSMKKHPAAVINQNPDLNDKREIQEVMNFEDDMLHITDPEAWQESQLDESEDDSIAVGGDDDRELVDAI